LKIKLVALTLIAFACWLVPFKTLAEETGTPQIKTEQVTSPINVSSRPIEPDKPLLTPTTKTVAKPASPPTSPKHSGWDSAYTGKTYSKEEVQQLIKHYSLQYGINPEVSLCIAKLESGFNQFSKNKSSTASGVFQYLSSTWKSTDESKLGLSVFDADANIRAAIKYMASRKSTQPWEVKNKCPKL
jgi:hypothetical protein